MKRKRQSPPGRPGTGALAQTKRDVVPATQMSVRREIEHIVDCATQGEARTVALGGLVFFSTTTQDAWVLDAEDGLAAPICRGGDVLDSPLLEEAEDRFSIDWPLDFQLEGETFVTEDRRTRRLVRVRGYPLKAIAGALEVARASSKR